MVAFSTDLRRDLPDQAWQMDAVEAEVAAWTERYQHYKNEVADAVEEFEEVQQQTARALVAVQASNLAARIVGLLSELIILCNSHGVYAAPAVARACFETCCIPLYMHQNLCPKLRKRRTNEVHRLLFRLGLGTGPGAGVGHIRAIRVSALLAAGKRWLADLAGDDDDVFEKVYGPLSDRTHPNWGAIYGAVDVPGPVLPLSPRFSQETIDGVLSAASLGSMMGRTALDRVVECARDVRLPLPEEPSWQSGDLHEGP